MLKHLCSTEGFGKREKHAQTNIQWSFTHISFGFQPSEEQVKEATDYCFQMLEKMDKARLEGDYHEVVYVFKKQVRSTQG